MCAQYGIMVIGFAHRGARTDHRDNTLPGFERALALGASGLESDAWLTADGIPVLDHDGVARRGLRHRPIRSLPRAALPSHVPSLADLYELPGATAVEVSLDVKDRAAVPSLLEVAGPHKRRLWLCASELRALASWRCGDHEIRLVHSSGSRRIGRDTSAHASRLAAAGIDALNLRAREWTAGMVDACHRSGVMAFGWDAQRQAQVSALAAMGIDGIYSDHVAMMMATLRTA